MNLGKKVQWGLALAGLGAFLLVVPAHAQQETDPDHYSLNGVEAYQESTRAMSGHRAGRLEARSDAQLAKSKTIADLVRASARAGRDGRVRAGREWKQTADGAGNTAALSRWL